MDANFQKLPPLKRFRLMQKQQQEEVEEQKSNESSDCKATMSCLPTKKRRESLYSQSFTEFEPKGNTVSNYCLPAKKRVWALQPDLLSDFKTPLSSNFDLNVEWKPSLIDESESKNESKTSPVVGSTQSIETIPPQKLEENREIRINTENGNLESKVELTEEKEDEIDDDDDDGIICAICQSTDGDSTDPIVLCDGCDLMVHTTCYGNPLVKEIPEGDWFCAQCLVSKSSQIENPKEISSCSLCPVKGGAMKRTNTNDKNVSWAHIVCSVFVPEVFFKDPEGREGIDCSKVPKIRWEKKCYVCKSRKGCAIECSELNCPLWFHVGCGLNEDLSIEYREGKNGRAVVAGFCKDHSELWKKQQQTGKFKIVPKEEVK